MPEEEGFRGPQVCKIVGITYRQLDYSARTGEEIVDLVRQGQGVLNIVPLAGVVEEIDAAIHELRPSEETAAAAPRAKRAAGTGG